MYDIVIKNGQIVDGSGKAAYYGDVAVKDGRIEKIAGSITDGAKEEIDASGLQVTPGFIDTHSHSDSIAFTGRNCYNYLEQGVTTQVAGNCGDSYVPSSPLYSFPFPGKIDETEKNRRYEISKTPEGFMQEAQLHRYGTNTAFLIGHGALRAKAMGYSAAVPSNQQMKEMKEDLARALEAGFIGYSTGLVYAPGSYAKEEELTELATVLPAYHGMYVSHTRSAEDRILEAVREAIAIGEHSGSDVLISHLKVCGEWNEGLSRQVLKEIDDAVSRGVSVWADQYPYTAGSCPLHTQIPPKFKLGGMEEFMKKLEDPLAREEMRQAIFQKADGFASSFVSPGYEKCLIVIADKTPQYVNKTVSQIAAEMQKEPFDAVCDLLILNNGVSEVVSFGQNLTDMFRIMEHKRVLCGSDWLAYPDERYDYEKEGGSHPRAVATMVRRLELVRDFRLRTMEESVKNLSLDTANALHFKEIGQIAEGWNADLNVLAYDRLHATCDYAHPFRKNTGIEWVLVNGQIAVKDGVITDKRAGRVLKRGM